MSSPELKPNRITDDEDKNKSSIELRPPKLKLGYALLMIATTSSPNCSNTFVVCSF
jgi:hypothetical protein